MDSPEAAGSLGLEEYDRLAALIDQRRFEEALIRGRLLLEQDDLCLLTRAKAHHLVGYALIEGLRRPSPEAVLHSEEAVRLIRALGDVEREGKALIQLGAAYFLLADYGRAETTYRQVLVLGRRHPGQLAHGDLFAYIGLGHTYAARGLDEEAMAAYAKAVPMAETPECRFFLYDVWRSQALVLARKGQAQEAQELLGKIDEEGLAYHQYTLWWKTQFHCTRARVQMAAGDWGQARETAVSALALARELGDLAVAAECCCCLALIDGAQGRPHARRQARLAITYATLSGRRDVTDDLRRRLRRFLAAEGGMDL